MADDVKIRSHKELDDFILEIMSNFLDNVSEMIELDSSEQADLEMAVRHCLQNALVQKLRKAPFWGTVEK